jgi:hypothetical protein
MAQILAWLSANKAAVFGVLFGISEALAVIPGIKANSIFQLVFGWIQKEQA